MRSMMQNHRPMTQAQSLTDSSSNPEYLAQLRNGGWAVLADVPYAKAADLIATTQAYFAQDTVCKQRDTVQLDNGHFDGYGSQGVHKEMLFIRNAPLPTPIAREAEAFWRWAHRLALSVLSDIAGDMGVAPHYFLELVTRVCTPPADAGTNVLRFFNYRPPAEAAAALPQPSNAHHDLGLLAIGLRSTPGLQVQTPHAAQWHAIEAELPATHAVVMVGRTLSALTGGRYPSCYHQVAHAETPRFSAVFQLRVRDDARLYSPNFCHADAAFPVPEFDLTGAQLHHFFDAALPSINRQA
jgi:isopenicillin N synthase-like dioxygenase